MRCSGAVVQLFAKCKENSLLERDVPTHFLRGVSMVPVREMALALLIQTSIPPNLATACATAPSTAISSLQGGGISVQE